MSKLNVCLLGTHNQFKLTNESSITNLPLKAGSKLAFPHDIRSELIQDYLNPPPCFPPSVACTAQNIPQADIPKVFDLDQLDSGFSIQLQWDPETGQPTSYEENYQKPEPSFLSGSLSRDVDKNFIRGNLSNPPFIPGGLPARSSSVLPGTSILSIPPGFDRGLASVVCEGYYNLNYDEIVLSESECSSISEQDDIDDLLLLPKKEIGSDVKVWAQAEKDIMASFYTLVPELAMKYPFELDLFQKQAIYHLEMGNSIFVAAHTSAGKTVVAEYAIALAKKHMTKAIYTSPIKALSNQKFRDFSHQFQDVGILTGDVQIKTDGACLIMTTEILRNMLYKGADLIRDVEFVIFDEVHYVNDIDRGVVWEEVIIMLPAHVKLILLSATVPNNLEFAEWVGRTKQRKIYVISTDHRPVPLLHFLYLHQKKEIVKIVDENKNFSEYNFNISQPQKPMVKKDKDKPRKQAYQKPIKPDKQMFNSLVDLLKKRNLLPVVIFTFSRKSCEKYAEFISSNDYLNSQDKSQVHFFLERSLQRLQGDDRQLPQILRLTSFLKNGIGVHHGGLLPLVKEIVEHLFSKGLVRVLFATETFAMGVNMPAKCVVFSSVRKHDGRDFRFLLPGEYTQMSGRAGRRGLDNVGMVIIMNLDQMRLVELREMITGSPSHLRSQFKLTYNMILNLLRVETLPVEEMIKNSFSENTNQKQLPEKEEEFLKLQQQLSLLEQVHCLYCECDLQNYHILATIIRLNQEIYYNAILNTAKHNVIPLGRVVIINLGTQNFMACICSRPEKMVFKMLVYKDTDPISNEFIPLPISKIYSSDHLRHEEMFVHAFNICVVTKSNVSVKNSEILILDPVTIGKILKELHKLALEFKRKSFSSVKVKQQNMLLETSLAEIKIFREMDSLSQYNCVECPSFLDHYAKKNEEMRIKKLILDLKLEITGQNLVKLPEYHKRIAVLKNLNYLDPINGTVQLKGRVACEINSADELVVTELVLNNFFAKLSVPESLAVLSLFIFQEKTELDSLAVLESEWDPNLFEALRTVRETAAHVVAIQEDEGLDIKVDEYLQHGIHYGLVNVVYEWAQGVSFKRIMDMSEVSEGSIVRCIIRLEEACREIKDAARLIGDGALFQKMEQASLAIKRDIVFCGSLYI